MHADYPETYDAGSGYTVTLTPFKEVLGKDARLTLWLLMGVAAFVLVIACANVANLTLMRGVRREHEMVVRAALGAGTARLRRLLFAEHLVLALAGAALGHRDRLRRHRYAVDVHVAHEQSRRRDPGGRRGARVHARHRGSGRAAALVRARGSGANTSSGADSPPASTRTTGSGRRRRLQQALVVTQIAVSVILLTGAGLLVQSMKRLAAVDPGLDTRNVLTMEVPADFGAVTNRDVAIATYERMATELKAIPGVQVVGLGSNVPLRVSQFQLDVKAEGRALAPGEPQPQAEFRTADPGYFKASGMTADRRPGLHHDGQRDVRTRGDRQPDTGEAPLSGPGPDRPPSDVDRRGPQVHRAEGRLDDGRRRRSATRRTAGSTPQPLRAIYMPFEQGVFPTGGLVIRTAVNPLGLARAAREVVHSVDPGQPIEKLMALDADS